MSRLQTIFILFLILCLFNFFLAGSAFSQQNWYAKADITKNKPIVKSLPEEKIPAQAAKGGGGKLLWALLGVALVGGIGAAVAGGGGGGGGGGGDDDDTPATGGVTVSW
jgi:hypothetical protein